MKYLTVSVIILLSASLSADIYAFAGELIWPVDCVPNDGICSGFIGYPDINENGKAFNCNSPGYKGHQGTDIKISWDQMDKGVSVFAAADGKVLWVFDGKYDRCPNPGESDCQFEGYRVCTESGKFCNTGTCCCRWCFYGGNVVVIRHENLPGIFATRYDHFKRNSITVSPGDIVRQGQKIGDVGSSGRSTGPHLHFEVWGTGFYELDDPWAGPCGPRFADSLWKNDPPWNTEGKSSVKQKPEKYSPWLSGREYQKEFERRSRQRFYPKQVEGREQNGRLEFRAIFIKYPIGKFGFYTHHGLIGTEYNRKNNEYILKGFTRIWHQEFTRSSGQILYQGTWIKQ
ncbi:MAG: M23 family metallopeptidase [Desulfobacteraceae bacterium]|nr:M23 family metallopeptidase [Desulfobacteraceae bacterium]